jgi:PKD repeat protein
MSAGGFIATHVAAMDKESERPSSTYSSFGVNDLGCIDCGSHPNVTSTVRGVLSYWGALQDTSIIEENVPPMLLMHGENDPTVPFIYGNPFGVITLPEVYGSQPISERLDNIGGTYQLVTSAGPLHMLEGSDNGTWNPAPNSFWGDTLLPITTSFVYNLIKPITTIVSPQSVSLCLGQSTILETSTGVNSHFIWDFNTTDITASNNTNTNLIDLQFNAMGTHFVKVVEFNEILCAGDTLEFEINVEELPFADFTATTTNNYEFEFTNFSTIGASYLWDFGDGTTSTDENPIHTYEDNGDFTVSLIATSANGCQSIEFTEQIAVYSLSIDEQDKPDIVVATYFTNSLIINSSVDQTNLRLYDTSGKLMFETSTDGSQTEIDSRDWNTGLYILQYSENNGNSQQIKLIKL